MTTKQAFQDLISQPHWFALCGITSRQAANLKMDLKRKKVSIDKQHELLKSAGYKLTEKWSKKK